MSSVREIVIAGSTGSIGTQAIDVVQASNGELNVLAIGANRSTGALLAQAKALHPKFVALGDATLAHELAEALPPGTELIAGEGALEAIGAMGDVVVNAVVGFAGLPVTLAALCSGRRLALANKESLIAAAPIVQQARRTDGAEIVPVDSEHCAIHQCLAGRPAEREMPTRDIRRLLLTASGGPFRGRSRAELENVALDEALSHPTWKMGPKITIDSSTLMNKGLEVIEAHELFGIDFDRIEVVVHPQSIIHSMVEFSDGATIAQLSLPDMRLPIAYAIAYPYRSPVAFGSIDWSKLHRLEFEEPDPSAFSCLNLAYQAGREGASAPAWLNAANEVAVDAFLQGRITWLGIAAVVVETLDGHESTKLTNVNDVLAADAAARRAALAAIERHELAA